MDSKIKTDSKGVLDSTAVVRFLDLNLDLNLDLDLDLDLKFFLAVPRVVSENILGVFLAVPVW